MIPLTPEEDTLLQLQNGGTPSDAHIANTCQQKTDTNQSSKLNTITLYMLLHHPPN